MHEHPSAVGGFDHIHVGLVSKECSGSVWGLDRFPIQIEQIRGGLVDAI
jgi:hypothetical protein